MLLRRCLWAVICLWIPASAYALEINQYPLILSLPAEFRGNLKDRFPVVIRNVGNRNMGSISLEIDGSDFVDNSVIVKIDELEAGEEKNLRIKPFFNDFISSWVGKSPLSLKISLHFFYDGKMQSLQQSVSLQYQGENRIALVDRVGPSQSGQQVAKVEKSRPEISKQAKPKASVAPQVTAPLPKVHTGTPVITIISPEVKRGLKVFAKEESLTVRGQATDSDGVSWVMVNGEKASLDEHGNFSADILLKVGENRITVTATNVHKNQKTETFTTVRQPEVVAKAKKTSPAAASELAAADADEQGRGKYYALVIGNNDYQHLSKLQTAVNDARDVAQVLKIDYGFEIKLVLDAKRKDILSSLNTFRQKLNPKDHFLIYYAGHGSFDKQANKGYWLPVDAEPSDPSEWIIADDITANIRRIDSRHILIVSDSCYSGTIDRSAETDLWKKGDREELVKKMRGGLSRTLMASGGNEPVSDGGGSGHSIFADSLLNALKGIEHKEFSADELFTQYVRTRVAGRSEQLPVYKPLQNSGHESGDFVFVRVK